jgi:parallel beta-helix repeat protein
VTNEDHASHSVKVRCLFDVADDVDEALCWVPGAGAITTEQEFKDLAYWEVKSGDAKSKLTPSCTFTPGNKPDKVQFASWDGIYYVPFDYTITEWRDITLNTAVAMYWTLGILAPGETKEVTFYYGIESHSIPSPAEIGITDLFTELDNANQSVKLYADLENDGDASLTNGQLAIIILNPNGEKVFGNVSTIAINPNQTISPYFTYNVPVNALSGVYTINATVYDAEMNLLDQREATFSVNSINVSISGLFPPDDVILSSNDVLFSWTTNVNSTTEVYIKPETESGYIKIKVTGESGHDHLVIVANLTRDINYTWYAKSSTPSGSGISDNSAFYIDNGIVFTEDTYAFIVDRDYNQRVNVSVKNTDSKPHELLVSANSDYEDIFVGFVGDGSVDRILSLNPGETRNITLVIHAHASELEDYAFTVGLTNLDAGNIIDYALILLTVRIGANIIYVPDDYPKIQTAVDAANPGDTIIVRDGTYTENIEVNKSLTVMSENGAESSIVQAECSDDHIFEVTADYVNISGFTVRSVRKSHDPTIQNAGIYLKSVVHCCISDNIATNNDFGILLYNSSTNTLTDNTANVNDAGIILYGSSSNVFYLNNFINNTENVRSYNSTNIWNSTSKIAYSYNGKNYENYLGNYWGDNEENDADEDGIGDTPYRIDLDKDLYPLMPPCKIYFKQLNDTDQIDDQRRDWMNEKYRSIREARTATRSPIGNKTNQNSFLSRNYNLNYQSVNGSFVKMRTQTDNELHGDVTIYRRDQPPDYNSCRGGDSRSWQVKYDRYAETDSTGESSSRRRTP